MRGLWQLTWIELKVFLREPLGAIGTIITPALLFILLGKLGRATSPGGEVSANPFFRVNIPVFMAILIACNTVLSLVAIIAIYREGGILKRLRATPLRPWTILSAHVLVKLLLTAMTLVLLLMAGKRYYPTGTDVPVINFALALLVSTLSILSMGFLIASIVPTARFAQPIGAVVLYPMVGLSGLFVPLAQLPSPLRHLPLAYAVSLLQGMWLGESWAAHVSDVAALGVVFLICTALSAKVFRWE